MIALTEQSFRRAVEVEPQNAWAHFDLGSLLVQRGSPGEGIEHLQIAVRQRPDLEECRFKLATALAQERRLAEAKAQCDALLQLAPQAREAQAFCDRLRSNLGKQPP